MTPTPDSLRLNETKLLSLRKAGALCDLVVRAKEGDNHREFLVHKLVLVAASPHFYDLHKIGKLKEDVLTLPDCVEATFFEFLLDYMYNETLTIANVALRLRHRTLRIPTSFEEAFDKFALGASFLGFDTLATVLVEWKSWSRHFDGFVKDEESMTPKIEEVGLVPPIALKKETIFFEDVGGVFDDEMLDQSADESEKKSIEKLTRIQRNNNFVKPRKKRNKTQEAECHFENYSAPSKSDGDIVSPFQELGPKGANMSIYRSLLTPSPSSERSVETPSPISAPDSSPPSPTSESAEHSSLINPFNGTRVDSIDSLDDNEDVVHPNEQIKTLNNNEVKELFQNPRDLQMIIKRRIMAKIEDLKGDANSWHHAADHPRPFLGTVIPFGNRQSKSWERDGKKIKGEIRGTSIRNVLELKLEDGSLQEVKLPRAPGKLWCPFCDERMSQGSRYKLGGHLLNEHGYIFIDLAKVCNLCDFVVSNARHLKEHLHRFHNIVAAKDERRVVSCKTRDHSRFCRAKRKASNAQGNKEGKKTKDVDGKKYVYDNHVCCLCGKTYKFSMGLENHMSSAHGAPYRFYCKQGDCPYGSNVKDPFLDHLYSAHKINVGAKPILKCKYCDYSTIRKHTYLKHVENHEETEPKYGCREIGCGKHFRQARHLRVHQVECHGNQSFPCDFCGGIYASKWKLRNHVSIMHTNRVRNYKCAYCSHATVQRTNCRTHIKSVHRGLPVTVVDLRKLGITQMPKQS